jgi:hypothetical protein
MWVALGLDKVGESGSWPVLLMRKGKEAGLGLGGLGSRRWWQTRGCGEAAGGDQFSNHTFFLWS